MNSVGTGTRQLGTVSICGTFRAKSRKIPGKLGEQQYKNMHQLQQLENTIQLNKYKFNCLFGELLM